MSFLYDKMNTLFSVVSNIMIAFLELCCARNNPDKVSTIKDLAPEEIDKILSYHSRCKCY